MYSKTREAAAKLMADLVETEDPVSASLIVSTPSDSYILTYKKEDKRSLPVITICGSTKFKQRFIEAAEHLERQGWAVFTVGFFPHADGILISEEKKVELDLLHKRKIAASGAIYVVNPEGYIGSSTRSEIEYARSLGKTILSLEPLKDEKER